MNLKRFEYEDGNFYCREKDVNNKHKINIITTTTTMYEVENGKLITPYTTIMFPIISIILSCSCGNYEDITDKFEIVNDKELHGDYCLVERR